MKSFNYHSAKNIKEATKLASSQSTYLAGGMTTLPAIKLRLAAYSDIIDIKKIKELSGIKASGKSLKIGATTTHAEVASSKKNISVFLRIILAIATLCFSPPDNFKPLSPTCVL